MNIGNSLNPDLKFLNGSQMVEAAATLDAIHTKTLKAIDRLQREVNACKDKIANQWKGTVSQGLAAGDVNRLVGQQQTAAINEIRRNSEKELYGYLKEAGAPHSAMIACRQFYDSPVKTLSRVTLGDPKRTEYLEQLELAGPSELGTLGQLAVSTGNAPLAAAILTRLDVMAPKDRPFGVVELAQAMRLEEHRKGVESLKIADVRLQAIVIAVRTWMAGKANPLNTVSLAARVKDLDLSILQEADDGSAG